MRQSVIIVAWLQLSRLRSEHEPAFEEGKTIVIYHDGAEGLSARKVTS